MLVTARAVRVPVGQFFSAGFTHVGDVDSEGEYLPCQGVIGINVGAVPADLGDSNLSLIHI